MIDKKYITYRAMYIYSHVADGFAKKGGRPVADLGGIFGSYCSTQTLWDFFGYFFICKFSKTPTPAKNKICGSAKEWGNKDFVGKYVGY